MVQLKHDWHHLLKCEWDNLLLRRTQQIYSPQRKKYMDHMFYHSRFFTTCVLFLGEQDWTATLITSHEDQQPGFLLNNKLYLPQTLSYIVYIHTHTYTCENICCPELLIIPFFTVRFEKHYKCTFSTNKYAKFSFFLCSIKECNDMNLIKIFGWTIPVIFLFLVP